MTVLSCLMRGKIFVFKFLFSSAKEPTLTVHHNHKNSTKTFKENPLWNQSKSTGNMTVRSFLMKGKIFVFTFLFSLLQNLHLTAHYTHKTSTKSFNETPLWNVGVHVSRKYDCTQLSHERSNIFVHISFHSDSEPTFNVTL